MQIFHYIARTHAHWTIRPAPKQELEREREKDKLIVSSTARGAAKNVIKIDVLLTEPVIIEAATL